MFLGERNILYDYGARNGPRYFQGVLHKSEGFLLSTQSEQEAQMIVSIFITASFTIHCHTLHRNFAYLGRHILSNLQIYKL